MVARLACEGEAGMHGGGARRSATAEHTCQQHGRRNLDKRTAWEEPTHALPPLRAGVGQERADGQSMECAAVGVAAEKAAR